MKVRNYPQFTHFACLPFTQHQQRKAIYDIQTAITKITQGQYNKQSFAMSNDKLAHITISMLVLHREDTRQKMKQVMDKLSEPLHYILKDTAIAFKKVNYFSKINTRTKKKEVTLLYLEIEKDENFRKIQKASDLFIREVLKADIVTVGQLKQMRIAYNFNENLYKNQENHLTLFRVKNVIDDERFQSVFKQISQIKMPYSFECRSFDISTRNDYSQNNCFYTPFYSISLTQPQEKKEIQPKENVQKKEYI